ncbi:hypothetical protein [Rubinisphaera margarita]|uniref:hypothetical protein n=1 Tax=Rubinisphaera margarita TaxID=2909586 RepID=UPI001EE970AF|nr:hypothetical protein [Rubinisphaera margarita]MCG6158056.1 hypothetical protein [Rubinisphaera margarita]
MSTNRIKAADRTKVCQQIVTQLKKKYGSRVPKSDHNVLDSLLFAICLEDATHERAEATIVRLHEAFFDYNEIRVSSITEVQHVFVEESEPEWRAMRVRESLQQVFEGRYSYDLEDFKKKNLDAAEKYLKQISSLTPFVMSHTMMTTLGTHTVPVDTSLLKCSIWLGLLPEDADVSNGSDQLKAAVRKADVPQFFHLIHELANDPEYTPIFNSLPAPTQEDPLDVLKGSIARLKDLLDGKVKPAPAKAVSSSAKSKSKTAEKASSGKTTKKTTKKKATKSSGGDKAPSKSASKASAPPKSSTATKKKTKKKS